MQHFFQQASQLQLIIYPPRIHQEAQVDIRIGAVATCQTARVMQRDSEYSWMNGQVARLKKSVGFR